MSLRDRSPLLLWGLLVVLSAAVTAALLAIGLPAAMMLGPMTAGIMMAANGARLAVSSWVLTVGFGVISCMIARSIDPALLRLVLAEWPVFLLGSVLVIGFGLLLGVLMARLRLMPGSTAIWGSAPGAVTIMLVMAAEARADVQLVAVMQFLRVVIVAGLAAIIALAFGTPSGATVSMSAAAPVAFAWGPFLATLALGTAGAVIGHRLPIPGAAMLLPMFAAMLLSNSGMLVVTQPDWLLIASYVAFGWSIGLGFTRETVLHAGRLLPRIIAFILVLTLLCAGLGYAMHLALGTDMLTAFLATSPAGMDLIAVIAASTHVDMGQVMGMQVARFMLISFAGPPCIGFVARWVERRAGEGSGSSAPPESAPDTVINAKSAEPFE